MTQVTMPPPRQGMINQTMGMVQGANSAMNLKDAIGRRIAQSPTAADGTGAATPPAPMPEIGAGG